MAAGVTGTLDGYQSRRLYSGIRLGHFPINPEVHDAERMELLEKRE